MRIKLYSCHHIQPVYPAMFDLFVPIWTGGAVDQAGRWLTDQSGLNIHPMVEFNELRQQFYVWRNLMAQSDYIGFEHYRRLFLIDPLPADECGKRYPRVLEARRTLSANVLKWRGEADPETMVQYIQLRRAMTAEQTAAVTDWIAGYDIVAPRRYTEFPVDEQWRQSQLDASAWQAFVDAMRLSSFWKSRTNYVDFSQVGAHFCNMYIMKTPLFAEYMALWSEVMFSVQGAVAGLSRYLGYLSERLFSFYVLQKQIENPLLRVADVPFLYCADMDTVARDLAAAGIHPDPATASI